MAMGGEPQAPEQGAPSVEWQKWAQRNFITALLQVVQGARRSGMSVDEALALVRPMTEWANDSLELMEVVLPRSTLPDTIPAPPSNVPPQRRRR